MPARDRALAYQDQAVHTADGPHLLVMICDRLAADIDRADAAIAQGDFEASDENLQHAQRSIRMLAGALDPNGFNGGHELLSVYTFLERHLIKANLEKSVALVRECGDIFRPIHEAWVAAVNLSERSGHVTNVG